MSKYNVHKRRTLDRLTAKYQYQVRRLMAQHAQKLAPRIHHGLTSGADFPISDADVKLPLKQKLYRILQDHQRDVVRVAISDGIQEVTPENELDLWMNHPLLVPVEDTLTVSLAGERDKIAKETQGTFLERYRKKIRENYESIVGGWLERLKQSYLDLSKDWIEGESSVVEVKSAIKKALEVSDSRAEKIFRTETTAYFNEARSDYFATNTSVDYMQLFAITDGRVSNICEDRHKFVMTLEESKLKKNMPPFHPNCRTIQRPLISKLPSHKKLIDEGLQKNPASFTPLPKGWA